MVVCHCAPRRLPQGVEAKPEYPTLRLFVSMESPRKSARISGNDPGTLVFEPWKGGVLQVDRATFLANLDLELDAGGKPIAFKKADTLHSAVSTVFGDAQAVSFSFIKQTLSFPRPEVLPCLFSLVKPCKVHSLACRLCMGAQQPLSLGSVAPPKNVKRPKIKEKCTTGYAKRSKGKQVGFDSVGFDTANVETVDGYAKSPFRSAQISHDVFARARRE